MSPLGVTRGRGRRALEDEPGRSVPGPGTDPLERIRRAKSRTARSPKAVPQDPRGAGSRAAGQTPPGARRPFIVGRSGEGGTEARTMPGRTWATLTPPDVSRKDQAAQGQTRPWVRSYHARAVARAEGPLTARGSVGSVPVGSARSSGLSVPWCRAGPPGAQGARRRNGCSLRVSHTAAGHFGAVTSLTCRHFRAGS